MVAVSVTLASSVAGVALPARPLPVEIDAVEHAGTGAIGGSRQVALDEQVDARLDERASRLGGERRVGEVLRPGPTAERDQHLELRVDGLELLELVEVAGQRRAGCVSDAVDRLHCGHRPLVVRPRVPRRAHHVAGPIGDDVAEGVVDVGQPAGAAVLVEVLDEEGAPVDSPLEEVADLDVLPGGAGLGGAGGAGRHHSERKDERHRARTEPTSPGPHGTPPQFVRDLYKQERPERSLLPGRRQSSSRSGPPPAEVDHAFDAVVWIVRPVVCEPPGRRPVTA
jgi:hypothetical protein